MDSLQLIQRAITALAAEVQEQQNSTTSNHTILPTAASPQAAPVDALPFALSSLITMFLSFSALRDWLKLIVIGGLIESCRRMCFSLWSHVVESFWLSASFDEDDESYGKLFRFFLGRYYSLIKSSFSPF